MQTLKECKFGIPNNPNDTSGWKNFLRIVGAKSGKELERKGKSVSIYLEDECLKISLYFFNGEYMTSDPARDLYCSLDPEEITKTLLQAFECCHAY